VDAGSSGSKFFPAVGQPVLISGKQAAIRYCVGDIRVVKQVCIFFEIRRDIHAMRKQTFRIASRRNAE